MKKLNYIVGVSIVAAFIVAMVAIFPVSADPPDRYEFPVWGEGTNTDCGVELTWHQELILKGFTWCNPATELCSATEHTLRENFTLTNQVTGRTLTFHGSSRTRFTWITWFDTLIEVSGNRFLATIPGVGPVFGSPGRHVFYETCQGDYPDTWTCETEILFYAGPVFDDLEAICTYMTEN